MFLAMRNETFGETLPVGEVTDSIAALLPEPWSLNVSRDARVGGRRLDAVIELAGPGADAARFAVEFKRSGSVTTAVALSVLRDLRHDTGLPVLFASDYIGPTLRAALEAEQMSFADATGWVRIVNDSPLVLLTGQGADRAPRARRSSSVTRLNGVAASRTIRTLPTVDLPCGVRRLAAVAEVSPGSVSKLLATLSGEGIVERDSAGAVTTVRARDLVRRWVQDYSFAKSNRSVAYYLAPRGLDRALERLAEVGSVTLTGSAAARRLLPESITPVVPLRLLALYTARPASLARALKLVDANPSTANVVIASPQDPEILPSPDEPDITIAPQPLVLADLLTLPGRSDAEADQLLEVLAASNRAWRESV